MKRRFFLVLMGVAIGAAFSARPVFAQDEAFTKRIISLGPAITEQLYLLGAREDVVGVTTYCRDSQDKEKIGTVLDVDIEKIIELKPDLVVATALTHPKTVAQLKKLGVRVEEYPLAKDFSQLCAQFIALGEIIGRPVQARRIARQAQEDLEAIEQSLAGLVLTKVLVQVGSNPLFVAPRDSFIHDSIRYAKGVNVVHDSATGLYSREQVLSDNPEVIVIISMGLEGEKEKESWQNYASIEAVRQNRVHVVDDYLYGSPTPATFVEGVRKLAAILHPDHE